MLGDGCCDLDCLPKWSQHFCLVFTRQSIMNRDFGIIFVVEHFSFTLSLQFSREIKDHQQTLIDKIFIGKMNTVTAAGPRGDEGSGRDRRPVQEKGGSNRKHTAPLTVKFLVMILDALWIPSPFP